MSAEVQTIVALAIVAITAALLVRAAWKKRTKVESGCGSDCGCAATDLKAKLKS